MFVRMKILRKSLKGFVGLNKSRKFSLLKCV